MAGEKKARSGGNPPTFNSRVLVFKVKAITRSAYAGNAIVHHGAKTLHCGRESSRRILPFRASSSGASILQSAANNGVCFSTCST